MSTLSVPRTALVIGVLMGVFHAAWAGLVAAGLAQPLLDFIFRLHFIDPPYHVTAFALPTAALLVGVTFGLGILGGAVLAIVWNVLAGK